jgi:hypothetical protein
MRSERRMVPHELLDIVLSHFPRQPVPKRRNDP